MRKERALQVNLAQREGRVGPFIGPAIINPEENKGKKGRG